MAAQRSLLRAPGQSDALDVFGRETSFGALEALAPKAGGVPPELWERALLAPVREILERPGKEFRGRLVSAAWRLAGGEGQPPIALSAALEIIHAGSMVVDDIEDESSERRGRPTLHRLFGTAVALNAGNWMYFLPLDLIGRLGLSAGAELELRRRMTRVMLDCHYGQALDLSARIGEVSADALSDVASTISTLKTGRLLGLAAVTGALAAGGAPSIVDALAAFGQAIGVGLQMLDDLGNLSGRAAGEKRFEDLKHGRVTWPWAWAAERMEAHELAPLVGECAALAEAHRQEGWDEGHLMRAQVLATRLRSATASHGKLQVHWHLDQALARLRARTGSSAGLTALESEMTRLEESYD